MAGLNPYQTYINVQFETADQGTLILMMYDAAIRFCKAGDQALVDADKAIKGEWLNRAFGVVGELRRTLRPDVGGEVAKQLDAAYAFITRQITLANVTGKREHIENAISVLEQLRDAWRQIVKESRSNNPVAFAG